MKGEELSIKRQLKIEKLISVDQAKENHQKNTVPIERSKKQNRLQKERNNRILYFVKPISIRK